MQENSENIVVQKIKEILDKNLCDETECYFDATPISEEIYKTIKDYFVK